MSHGNIIMGLTLVLVPHGNLGEKWSVWAPFGMREMAARESDAKLPP
jgi:hypothetical protein